MRYYTLMEYPLRHVIYVLGRFDVEHFKSKELSKDELYTDMRREGISHLGQVKSAYLEPGGDISLFYFEDENVRYGLPLLPELNDQQLAEIKEEDIYACAYCGDTANLKPAEHHECHVCKRRFWIKAIKDKRVT